VVGRFSSSAAGKPVQVRALVVILTGLAIGGIVFLATGGRVIFLPLVFVPFVLLWPFSRRSRRRW
jgi:hypothetical protein